MGEIKCASLESQLGNEPCLCEDTEEMFWLRQADDCQSKAALGNALAAQYRFREAAEAYRAALRIRGDMPQVYLCLGGALLTVREFGGAKNAFDRCRELGMPENAVAYHMGAWHYLQGDFTKAAKWFEKCLPCGDELAVAVIYWHTLCGLRGRFEPGLLSQYHSDMKAGHHTAYLLALSVFSGETAVQEAEEHICGWGDLDFVTAAYGLSVYLSERGAKEESWQLRQALLERRSVWPCVPYLAAWGEG